MPTRLAVLALIAACAIAQDWPQFLGPDRNGVYPDNDLAAKWSASGPAVVWEKDVGQGFSAPVVSQGRLILFHRLGDREAVEALDAATGRPVWKFDYPTGYRDDFGFDEGPRAAPAIAGGRVYTFGAEGALHCLDFQTGKKIWSVDTHAKFQVRKGYFGAACSPLVDEGRVLMNIGGAGAGVVAFDAATGAVLWKATDQEASYSSPVAATIQGVRHVFFFTRAGFVDVDPASGKVRSQLPWRARMQASVNAAAPIVVDDMVFLSASYGTGAILLQIGPGGAKKVWSSDDALTNHYANAVYKDGFLYGYHGRQEEGPSLRCIEFRTGKVRWSVDGFRAGSITLAGGRLLIQKEGGELVLAEASPAAYKPISTTKALPPVVRSYPAIAKGRYYVRNGKTLVCLNLK
ncbi:MAG TPA: PQQ-binding-like beta-propeller repeat protein [Bryobacteraceae bacterium]|nr:PQQ-binding-like beta-propeller repeat protein [Bryobacteraceae bacterium]